jgi:hypothetical protein
MEEADDDKQPRARWLDAARCAVVALVTALTIAVIARGVAVSLRTEKLELSIINGHVAMDKITSLSPPVNVIFHFNFRCHNPSRRAGVRYQNVTASFLYNNKTEMTWTTVSDINVEPDMFQDKYMNPSQSSPDYLPMEFVQWIYNKHDMKDMIVLFKGVLQTQVSLVGYTNGRLTQYFAISFGMSHSDLA